MPMTSSRPHSTLLLAVPALLFAAVAFSQDKPDRPPWAQKPKASSSANSASTSTPSAGSNTSPNGDPGKIVQPTPPGPADDSQETAAQRGRIRVNVNLVNVLVSVLDEKNHPAPDLPREAFRLFEEGVEQKIAKFESETLQPLNLPITIHAILTAPTELSFAPNAPAPFTPQFL